MSEINYQDKMAQAVKMISEKGAAYAKARATSWYMQEMRKVVLADEFGKQDPDLTAAERENKARVSQSYQEHLNGTKEAIHAEHVAKAELERWETQFEALRSLCSRETARIRAIGGSDLDTE